MRLMSGLQCITRNTKCHIAVRQSIVEKSNDPITIQCSTSMQVGVVMSIHVHCNASQAKQVVSVSNLILILFCCHSFSTQVMVKNDFVLQCSLTRAKQPILDHSSFSHCNAQA